MQLYHHPDCSTHLCSNKPESTTSLMPLDIWTLEIITSATISPYVFKTLTGMSKLHRSALQRIWNIRSANQLSKHTQMTNQLYESYNSPSGVPKHTTFGVGTFTHQVLDEKSYAHKIRLCRASNCTDFGIGTSCTSLTYLFLFLTSKKPMKYILWVSKIYCTYGALQKCD